LLTVAKIIDIDLLAVQAEGPMPQKFQYGIAYIHPFSFEHGSRKIGTLYSCLAAKLTNNHIPKISHL
jgi:hypothetical protein